jgi:tetratricopeptide (TPR) repeat protein
MKRTLIPLLCLAPSFLALPAMAAPAAPLPAIEAQLVGADGSVAKVFVVTATKASIRYRLTKDAAEIKDAKVSDFSAIRVTEPKDYHTAIDLFQARRYLEAKALFAALEQALEPVSTLPDNPGTLSAFYEMECLRKLGDLEGLAAALGKFNKDPLVRENQLRQVEIYLFWDAVRNKDWGRVESMAKDRQKSRLPGYQRAQIAWCHALALEQQGKRIEALDAYNTVLTADAGASEEITLKAALAILKIHAADPAVREALKSPVSTLPAGQPIPPGQAALAEARAVAGLFELSLGGGEPLPPEYQIFLPK